MTEKPQPPLPADDDEARFDDEGSAIGHPEPDETGAPTQKTKIGSEIPVPKRGEFFDNLKRASAPDRKPAHGSESTKP